MILYFHGNGEIASDYDTIAPFYTRLGITLFVVDYRGYGLSDGTPVGHDADRRRLDGASARTRSCWRAVGVAAGALFVMGRSLGSAAALEIVDRTQSAASTA